LDNCPIEASRNHGNWSNDKKTVRRSILSERPRVETLVTSTREVPLPRGADLILMSPNYAQDGCQVTDIQAVTFRDFDPWLEPHLGLSVSMLNVDVHARLFAREEVYTIPAFPENRRTHAPER
jgi:hypothetical protein